MSHCKYHPLAPATYYCRACQINTCDQCCGEHNQAGDEDSRRCFICFKPMTYLGAAHSVEPFWRRLDKIYRYGLAPQPLIAIVVCSVLSALSLYEWWLAIIPALLMTRYSFHCLDETARGKLRAPNFSESFTGGLLLIGQLFAILFVAFASLAAATQFVGPELTFLIALAELFALPAVFILLAINGTLSESLNPSNIMRLIASCGAAYIVMLLFVFVMIASVELLSAMIGEGHAFIQFTTSSIISNYYTIIVFHLMGYLVFQKQDALGFYAGDSEQTREPRSETDISLAQIEVLVKEGHYDHALDLYRELLPKNYNNLSLWQKCLRLMCIVGSKKQIARMADQILPRLLSRNDEFAVSKAYRDIKDAYPAYLPEDGELRVRLAQILFNLGDYRAVAGLLNNFHKDYQDKPLINQAYTLLANALERIPGLEEKAKSYHNYLSRLREVMEKQYQEQLKENPLAKFNKRF